MQLIKERLTEMCEKVLEGQSDPLEIYAYLKDYETHIKNCLSQVKEAAISEAEKFEGKSFDYLGLKFELRNGKANYDFKHIDKHLELKAEIKRIEEISKAAAKNQSIAVDPTSGEEIEPCKITYSASSLIVKL